jgi:hypothetical protein
MEAELAQNYLRGNDIEAKIAEDHASGGPYTSMKETQLLVKKEDAEKAAELLKRIDEQPGDA